MNEQTRERLLKINQRFYDDYAAGFGATRQKPWAAWETLLRGLPENFDPEASEPLRILDVGCGNGRFGELVAGVLERPLLYSGVDHSLGLLDQARHKLEGAFDHLTVEALDPSRTSLTVNWRPTPQNLRLIFVRI